MLIFVKIIKRFYYAFLSPLEILHFVRDHDYEPDAIKLAAARAFSEFKDGQESSQLDFPADFCDALCRSHASLNSNRDAFNANRLSRKKTKTLLNGELPLQLSFERLKAPEETTYAVMEQ